MENKPMDSKVVIIDTDGYAHNMGHLDDPKVHAEYLSKFLKKNYDGFDLVDSKTLVNELIDSLVGFGNVVFLNERLFGAIFIPSELNDKQISAIYDMYLAIGDLQVYVNQKPNMDFGYPLYQVNDMDQQYTLKEIVDDYMNVKSGKEHHRHG